MDKQFEGFVSQDAKRNQAATLKFYEKLSNYNENWQLLSSENDQYHYRLTETGPLALSELKQYFNN